MLAPPPPGLVQQVINRYREAQRPMGDVMIQLARLGPARVMTPQERQFWQSAAEEAEARARMLRAFAGTEASRPS